MSCTTDLFGEHQAELESAVRESLSMTNKRAFAFLQQELVRRGIKPTHAASELWKMRFTLKRS